MAFLISVLHKRCQWKRERSVLFLGCFLRAWVFGFEYILRLVRAGSGVLVFRGGIEALLLCFYRGFVLFLGGNVIPGGGICRVVQIRKTLCQYGRGNVSGFDRDSWLARLLGLVKIYRSS
jgi:hypothetical protein